MKVLFTCALLLGLLTAPALAQTKISGTFTATKACPALQSIKKSTNPGNVMTAVGTAYKVIGGNKEPAAYYWIVVPGATPDYRWVPVDCGTADVTASAPATSPSASSTSGGSSSGTSASGSPQYVLAI